MIVVPIVNVTETIQAILQYLIKNNPRLIPRVAGLSWRAVEDRAEIIWYVAEANRALQEQIDESERAFLASLEDLSLPREASAHAVLVQIGTVQPVALGNPETVVTLGARIALDNDPTDGTLGAILEDRAGNQYLLTCRHVLDGRARARVVLRNVAEDDQLIARLTAVSQWNLSDYGQSNQTDFALARLLDSVIADPKTPIGTPPLKSTPNPSSWPPPVLVPLLNLHNSFEFVGTVYFLPVQFPYGEVRLSNMWLVRPVDQSKSSPQLGDSGSLFVSRDSNHDSLIPEALAVAVTDESSVWLPDKREFQNSGPLLLLCPLFNIFCELEEEAGITDLKVR